MGYPLAVDAYDELQALCAAYGLGLALERSSAGRWLVRDDDAGVRLGFSTRRDALNWLAVRVFEPHAPWRIDWNPKNE